MNIQIHFVAQDWRTGVTTQQLHIDIHDAPQTFDEAMLRAYIREAFEHAMPEYARRFTYPEGRKGA